MTTDRDRASATVASGAPAGAATAEVFGAIAEAMASGTGGALATVVRVSGSTPQVAGARLFLFADGRTVGTVGGGAVEAAVRVALEGCLREGGSRLETWDLGRDLGMCCGGRMEVFLEALDVAPHLIVFGAGHVAEPTAKAAQLAGYRVTVIDDREELCTTARFPGATCVAADPGEALAAIPPSERDAYLVVTHDHQLDAVALAAALVRPHAYVGMIGSRRKVIRILQRLAARGGLPSLERVFAPVGLALGAITPGEIAIAIAAELVALRRGAAAPHLRITTDPSVQALVAGGPAPLPGAPEPVTPAPR